ncbi:MAG: NAD(+)/NADH kinase [Acidobacteria bacterium]|nr:NAD(+)/NADH kinase [Acidobacteriota bacterium]
MPKGQGLLVYNPKAGNRDRRDEMFRTMERLDARGLSLVNLPTERAGHATELVRKHLTEGPDVVVVCGGDGTVGEAAAALVGTVTPIAILPGGTTNVVAREYGIGLDMRRAEEIVLSDATRRLTTWTSAGRTSLIGTGVGFDGRVMTNIVPWLKRAFGRVGIGWTATLEWLKYEFPGIRVDGIDAEGRAFTREATFVLSANTRKYGGDPVLSTYASPEDDLLDLVLFTSRSRKDLLAFYHLLSGGKARHLGVRGVERFPVREFRARSLAGYELEVQVDGDPAGATPVSVGPAAGSVLIVVPGS